MKSGELAACRGCLQFIQRGAIINRIFKRAKCLITNNILFLFFTINLIPIAGLAQQENQTRNQEIKAFIKQQSLVLAKRAEDWARDKTGDILLEGVQEFLQENSLDKNVVGKILSSMAQNKKALQQIYEGTTEMDIKGAFLSTQLLIGKILAENVPESKMAGLLNDLTKYPDVAAEASQALGSFAGGDYYTTSETIGRLIWKRTAIGKSINVAIDVEKAGWDFLTQNQYDAAYQKYKEQGSEGLVRLFSGPAAYVREKYFQGRSVGDEVIASKMTELFDATRRQEKAALVEQVKLERMYAMFQQMEKNGNAIFDIRKHWEQNGVNSESEVFNKFLWLSRSIRRDLLSVGLDSWQLGKTLNGGNPAFAPEAMSLLLAFAQGGEPAYKEKFAAIARTRFPKRVLKSDIVKTNEFHFIIDELKPNSVNGNWDSRNPFYFSRSTLALIKEDDMKWNGGHFTRTVNFNWGDKYETGSVNLVIDGDVDPGGTRLISLKGVYHSEEKEYNDIKVLMRMDIRTYEIELRDIPLKLGGTLSWECELDSSTITGCLVKYRTFGSYINKYETDHQETETWDYLVRIKDILRARVFLFFDAGYRVIHKPTQH